MNAADPKVVQALQHATLLELFALSTLIDRLMADPATTRRHHRPHQPSDRHHPYR